MVSKNQPVILPPPPPPPPPPVHLETIYEESGSSLSSSVADVHHQSRHRQKSSTYNTDQTIQGLISARSIPSVDAHRRRRTHEQHEKPPIEVRQRDGTKHYIHPSLTSTSMMIINRRKYTHSSRHDSSTLATTTTKMNSKYRQILNPTSKKKKKLPKKSEIILTIITAEDLSQAGITPPSTSSPDESETLVLTKSQSNSSLDTIKTVKDISLKDTVEAPIERLPTATVPPSIHPVQPVVDISISSLRFPPAPRYHSQHQPQLRHPQQMATVRSQSLPPSQSQFLPSTQQKSISYQVPPVAVVPPSPKKPLPSLQITLKSNENEKNLSSKVKHSNTKASSLKSSNETTNSENKQPFRPSATVLVGGGSRSAFRPFHKSANLHLQSQLPLNINTKSYLSTNQFIQKSSQQQHSYPHSQQYRPTSSSKSICVALQPTVSMTINSATRDRRSMSSDASKKPVNTVISNQILSDTVINSTSKPKLSNYSQQAVPIFTTKSTEEIPDDTKHAITFDSSLQWHSVTSKSLYDVPRLSHQYSDIPLRITIPDGTPTHNQKLLYKHDIALEQRLLDAGLSPETIALYERILEVADLHQLSPPELINQYQHRSML